MGNPEKPRPVCLFVGMLSGDPKLFSLATAILERKFGGLALESNLFPFDFTDYYAPEMGENLLRKFVSFKKAVEPERLAEIKIFTNKLEQRFAVSGRRQINLDPGVLTPAKVILTSTKDFSHRIYLKSGIYAEVTLTFRKGRFEPLNWTYPDYRTENYQAFFQVLRKYARNLRPAE